MSKFKDLPVLETKISETLLYMYLLVNGKKEAVVEFRITYAHQLEDGIQKYAVNSIYRDKNVDGPIYTTKHHISINNTENLLHSIMERFFSNDDILMVYKDYISTVDSRDIKGNTDYDFIVSAIEFETDSESIDKIAKLYYIDLMKYCDEERDEIVPIMKFGALYTDLIYKSKHLAARCFEIILQAVYFQKSEGVIIEIPEHVKNKLIDVVDDEDLTQGISIYFILNIMFSETENNVWEFSINKNCFKDTENYLVHLEISHATQDSLEISHSSNIFTKSIFKSVKRENVMRTAMRFLASQLLDPELITNMEYLTRTSSLEGDQLHYRMKVNADKDLSSYISEEEIHHLSMWIPGSEGWEEY